MRHKIIRRIVALAAIVAALSLLAVTPASGKGRATKASLTAQGCNLTVTTSFWKKLSVQSARTTLYQDANFHRGADEWHAAGLPNPYSVTFTLNGASAPFGYHAVVELYSGNIFSGDPGTLVDTVTTGTLTSNCF